MHRARLLCPASVVTAALLALALLTVAPVTRAGAQVAAAPGNDASGKNAKLVIASLAPETGDLTSLLDSLRAPVQLAVDEINAAGGVNGQPVTLVAADDGTSVDVVAQTVDTLIKNDEARVIIGPASSPTALGILSDVKDKALMCSGSNTAAQLDQDGPTLSGGLYFRTAPPDSLQGPALAELLLADGRSKVGIVALDDSWLAHVGDSLATELEQGGAKVVADERYNATGGDVTAQVKQVLSKKPDSVVVLGTTSDGAKVVQAMIAAGATPATLPTYTANGMQDAGFGQLVDPTNPAAVAGIKGTAPAASPAGVDSPFQSVFATKDIEPVFSAHSYDCTILAALAAVKAKSDDPAKMAKAFTANLKGRADCNTFAACTALLAKGKSIHWRGASSSFDKFSKNQPGEGVYDVWSYDATGGVVTEGPASQITIR